MEQIQSKEKVVMPSLIEVRGNQLFIVLSGNEYTFDLSDISDRLASAAQSVRQKFIVSPSGYGIHWPDIDEDISIPTLIKTYH